MLNDKELQLANFGEYLLRKSLVQEKAVRFHVQWVRRFLHTPVNPGLSLDDRIQAFADQLRSDGRYEHWQVAQAERAVQIYFHTFMNGTACVEKPLPRVAVAPDGTIARAEVLEVTRNVLRNPPRDTQIVADSVGECQCSLLVCVEGPIAGMRRQDPSGGAGHENRTHQGGKRRLLPCHQQAH